MFNPKRIGVIGAGNMGLQAAMVFADQGYNVDLFDLPGLARKNLANAVKNGLGALTGRQRVTPLDLVEENYARLGECDWILEAVFERRDVKDHVNRIIAKHKKPGAWVTTNTSGISFNELAAEMGPEFAKHYALTHFFNPVKVLPLLEVCGAQGVDTGDFAGFCAFLDQVVGKRLVYVRDTPNFVGNRIGGLALFLPFHIPHEGLTITDVEAIMKAVFGWEPYKTWDIVGLDLADPVGGNVFDRAADDPLHEWWNPKIPEIRDLLGRGFIGRKGKTQSGFLARRGKEKLRWDQPKGDYVTSVLTGHPTLAKAMEAKTPKERLRIMLTSPAGDPDVKFAKQAFFTMVAYSARMVGQICDEYTDIDACLETGFNWPLGIFKLAQEFGIQETIGGVEAQGLLKLLPPWFVTLGKQAVPAGRQGQPLYNSADSTYFSVSAKARRALPRVEGGIYPEELAAKPSQVVKTTPDLAIVKLPDCDVVLAMVTAKANAIGTGVLDGLNHALDYCESHGFGLVIGGQGRMFGSGANLKDMLGWLEAGDTKSIRHLIEYGQTTYNRLCFSSIPTVAAPHGITYGGSCELCLACDRRVVNANVVMGQTELQVGVTPGWGGLMRPLKRVMQGLNPHFLWGEAYSLNPAVAVLLIHVPYDNYSWIKTSRDGYHARDMGWLGPEDVIVPAQGRGQPWVLKRAAQVAQSMLDCGYRPPPPFVFNLPGRAGFAKLQLAAQAGCLVDAYPVMDPVHNTICAERGAWVLCGGDTHLGEEVPESRLLELEREAFMDLVMRPGAAAYIRKLLKK